MKLDDNSKKKILALWEERVRKSSPQADDQQSFILRDHLPQFLDSMIVALRRDQTPSESRATDKLSQTHGKERSLLEDYSLEQVLREYSILRSTTIEVLGSDEAIRAEDQTIMHGLFDDANMIAGSHFSEARKAHANRITEELQRSNADLERFSAIAAHDLRSPIATIHSAISIIKEETKNPTPEVEEYFKFVATATESVLLLIERLLTYASIGKSEPKTESVDLNQLVKQVVANLGKAISDSGARIVYENLPTIQADPTLVGQLFQNLISNSIKFRAAAAPVIEIALEKEEKQQLTLSLKDNGIGFKPDQARVIFEPFKRLHGDQKYEGSGLGLSTARRVVEVLGGKIWAESEEGKGAKFVFTILREPSPKPHKPSPARP